VVESFLIGNRNLLFVEKRADIPPYKEGNNCGGCYAPSNDYVRIADLLDMEKYELYGVYLSA
jgi:hypothetical protein